MPWQSSLTVYRKRQTQPFQAVGFPVFATGLYLSANKPSDKLDCIASPEFMFLDQSRQRRHRAVVNLQHVQAETPVLHKIFPDFYETLQTEPSRSRNFRAKEECISPKLSMDVNTLSPLSNRVAKARLPFSSEYFNQNGGIQVKHHSLSSIMIWKPVCLLTVQA